MSPTSKSQAMTDQDDEMLSEYDFSHGVRGKYFDRNLAPQLPGVQFLRNSKGQKTAVLLNLQVHQSLWQQILSNHIDESEFQYLTDSQTHTQSVFIDFKTNLVLWQEIYDRIIA